MPKRITTEIVQNAVRKLNADRGRMRELERQLKPYLEAKRVVAAYLKENPNVDMVFDGCDEHYCFPVKSVQTRFNAEMAKEKLGDIADECYEDKTVLSVGFGIDQRNET